MVSISHWGMFPIAPQVFTAPPGFRVVEGQDLANLLTYPGAMIEIERDTKPDWWPEALWWGGR